jgi:hypothetical protein
MELGVLRLSGARVKSKAEFRRLKANVPGFQIFAINPHPCSSVFILAKGAFARFKLAPVADRIGWGVSGVAAG